MKVPHDKTPVDESHEYESLDQIVGHYKKSKYLSDVLARDLGLSFGYTGLQRDPYPPELAEARARVFAACRERGIAYLEGSTPDNIAARLDEGVRVIAGGREDTAIAGRAHQRRTMPV